MVVGYIAEKIKGNNLGDLFKNVEIKYFNNNYIINIYQSSNAITRRGNIVNNIQNINVENAKKKVAKREKIIKKVIKILKLYKIDTVVFSKEIKQDFQKDVLERLEKDNYNINFFNGKRLMKFMDFEIINYILEKQDVNMENEEIYIVFKNEKNYNLNFKTNLENLKSFLNKYIYNFRLTNVVSKDIRELRKLQEYILEKDNILIAVSNNKRKALKRAKYILNLNLTKSELEKYNINRNAIIINLEENVIYDDKTFNGININYFELEIPDEYIETFEEIGEKFDFLTLYETIVFINSKRKKMLIKDIINEDKVRIKYLIGNNGIISTEELKQMVKTATIDLDKTRKLV